MSSPSLSRPVRALLAAALALAGCEGNSGTIAVGLVTAPDSTVMDDVVHARLTLSDPPTVVERDVDADGKLRLDLDVEANSEQGTLTFEGFDADDQLVAFGRSPSLPIAAVEASIVIYVAAPLSVAEAPVVLEPKRVDMGATRLAYGVLYAGGRTGAGVVGDVALYNAYSHEFQVGADLPEPRAAATLLTGSGGLAYIFGGIDSSYQDRATLWGFDTNVAPAGAYTELTSKASLARSGAVGAPLGQETYLVTGDPLVVIDGLSGSAAPSASGPPIEGTATTVVVSDSTHTLFTGNGAGSTHAILYADGQFTELADAPAELARDGHTAVVLDGDIVIVGGADADGPLASAVRYDVEADQFTVIPDLLATPRRDAAIAAAGDYLVVAGGTDADGGLVGDVEVFDSELSRVTTLPMVVPRRGAIANALGDGQVIIAGGTDADDAATEVIELFTPDH